MVKNQLNEQCEKDCKCGRLKGHEIQSGEGATSAYADMDGELGKVPVDQSEEGVPLSIGPSKGNTADSPKQG